VTYFLLAVAGWLSWRLYLSVSERRAPHNYDAKRAKRRKDGGR